MKPAPDRGVRHLARGGDHTDTAFMALNNYSAFLVSDAEGALVGLRLTRDVHQENEHAPSTDSYSHSRPASPAEASGLVMVHFKVEYGS